MRKEPAQPGFRAGRGERWAKKGTLLTVEGYFKPEEWADNEGVKHNRIVMVATKLYVAEEKEEETLVEPAKKATRKGKK